MGLETSFAAAASRVGKSLGVLVPPHPHHRLALEVLGEATITHLQLDLNNHGIAASIRALSFLSCNW